MTDQALEKIEKAAKDSENIQKNWRWLLILGIVWIALGGFAVIMPLAATFAIELLLGVIFLVGGAAQMAQSLQWRGWRGFGLHTLGGAISLLLGLLLLLYPLQGVQTLTLILAVFFMVAGIAKIILAGQHRAFAGWRWMLFSGVAAFVVGGLIFWAWPGTAAWMLGLLIGIELIFSGWSMVMLAVSARCD